MLTPNKQQTGSFGRKRLLVAVLLIVFLLLPISSFGQTTPEAELISLLKQLIVLLQRQVVLLQEQIVALQEIRSAAVEPKINPALESIPEGSSIEQERQKYRDIFRQVTPYQLESCDKATSPPYSQIVKDYPVNQLSNREWLKMELPSVWGLVNSYESCIEPMNERFKTPEQMEAYRKLKELDD